nr:hypothetical protein [Tanacetum cinerariifolium]
MEATPQALATPWKTYWIHAKELEAWVPDFHDKSFALSSFDDESLGEDEGQASDIKSQKYANDDDKEIERNKENVGQSLEEDPQYPSGFTPIGNDAEKGVAQCVDNFDKLISSNLRNKNGLGSSKGAMSQRSANLFSKVRTGDFSRSDG